MSLNPTASTGRPPSSFRCPACPGRLVKNEKGTRFVCERGCGTEQYVGHNGRPSASILSGPLVGKTRYPTPTP